MEYVIERELLQNFGYPICYVIDVENTFEDALVLAQLYAEEHWKQVYGKKIPILAETKDIMGRVDGYMFYTTNATRVIYDVVPRRWGY